MTLQLLGQSQDISGELPASALDAQALKGKRLLIIGLGPLSACAETLLQRGVGSAPGGSVRLLGLSKSDGPEGREAARRLTAKFPQCSWDEGIGEAHLSLAIEQCDLVIDATNFIDGERKCTIYRHARSKHRPVLAAFATGSGATAYYFSPDSPIGFEDLFSAPPPDVRRGWQPPISRLTFQDETEAQFRLFQILNHRERQVDAQSLEAARFLLQQLALNALLGGILPEAPVACFLEPEKFLMGTVHLGKQVAEQSESIWTRIASVYDEFLLAAEDNVYLSLVQKICRDLAGCERVLEAGCGTGNICQALAERGSQAYGIDRNLAMLARATHRASRTPGMLIADGDVQKLYFPDEYFDGYCSNNVVFDADIEVTLREAYRVLKPGGKLAIASSQISPNIEALGAVPSYFAKLDAAVASEFVACQKEIYAGRSLKYGFQTHGVAKVEKLLLDTGFTAILNSETVYAGHSFYLVAQK